VFGLAVRPTKFTPVRCGQPWSSLHWRPSGRLEVGSVSSCARKRTGWWVALALPAFLLRGLIPIGFMPGTAGLQVCHGDHGTGHLSPASQHGTSEHGKSCVFAIAGSGLASPPAQVALVTVLHAAVRVDLRTAAERPISRFIRTQLPRGPPLHS
jgi:hypothetical protein